MASKKHRTRIVGSVRRVPEKRAEVEKAFEPVRNEIRAFRREVAADSKRTA